LGKFLGKNSNFHFFLIEQMRLICLTFSWSWFWWVFFIIYFSKSIFLLSDGGIWQAFDTCCWLRFSVLLGLVFHWIFRIKYWNEGGAYWLYRKCQKESPLCTSFPQFFALVIFGFSFIFGGKFKFTLRLFSRHKFLKNQG
jgi:hypothetical protein